jgi:hypothetical protein
MIAALVLEQPFPFGTVLVPPVRLVPRYLSFRPQEPLRPARGQPERLVYDFAALSDAPETKILEFATVWGVLGLCHRHGKPLHHQVPACTPRRVGDEFFEPIAGWRGRARYVRSILNIKAALNRGDPGLSADWKAVWRGAPPGDRSLALRSLALVASIFLSEIEVQPMLQCVNQRLAVTFIGGKLPQIFKSMAASEGIGPWLSSSGTLLAEIGMRTVLALQEGAGWATCSNPDCRRLYRPKRHLAEGRLNFCTDCGKRVAWRLSKQRASARRRRAGRPTHGAL